MSAPIVSALGGVWGNESAYADCVPNGGPVMIERVESAEQESSSLPGFDYERSQALTTMFGKYRLGRQEAATEANCHVTQASEHPEIRNLYPPATAMQQRACRVAPQAGPADEEEEVKGDFKNGTEPSRRRHSGGRRLFFPLVASLYGPLPLPEDVRERARVNLEETS